MSYTFGRIKVESFDKWNFAFNDPKGVNSRKAAGAKSWKIFRVEGKPNEIAILMEWDSLDNARKFLESKELRETQAKAGVIALEEHFLEEA